MTAIFADRFYWIALSLPADPTHMWAMQIRADIVTTEEVLTEYLTFFCEAPEYLRREVTTNIEAVLTDASIRIIPQTHVSFTTGFDLYKARPDKGYSMVDCISTQTMRREGLTDVLTNAGVLCECDQLQTRFSAGLCFCSDQTVRVFGL